VHFFLTSAQGNVILVTDVNARVAKLLSSPWKSDSKEFLRVETIQERKVKLETID
jgi:translation initiation factor 6 (eIF-6)